MLSKPHWLFAGSCVLALILLCFACSDKPTGIDVNQPPVLAAIGPQSTDENVNLNFRVSASDADGTTPTLSTSPPPTGAVFTDNLDGTGTFDWTPDLTQAGDYNVTFYATDGVDTDSEVVAITVNSQERKAFADLHWFYDRYIQSLEAQYPSADWAYGDTAKWYDADIADWANDFSEHLDVWIDEEADSARPIKNDAYYVNIGKYDQYIWGWEDTEYPEDSTSTFRETYLQMRK